MRLRNFRGFADHTVRLHPATVIVGANNAGKSTLVEALRLVALVVERIRRGTGRIVPAPDWLDHPEADWGLSPALRGQAADGFSESLFYRYGDPPAIVDASYAGGAAVKVFIGVGGEIHGLALEPSGRAARSPGVARRLQIQPIAIQPQVSPLLRQERLLEPETIRRGDGTYLAPQHFRNQLELFKDSWDEFRNIAESSWPGLQVRELRKVPGSPKQSLHLDIRDGDFVGEVSLMGHGLQMWLQTMWFLARADSHSIVVLDEPDVYMHPDLQRRLLNLVRSRFSQLLIATQKWPGGFGQPDR
jgi:hypothetical protein